MLRRLILLFLMVGIFMAQLHPTGGLNLDQIFEALAYQSIAD